MMQIKHLGFTYGKNTVNECRVLEDINFEIGVGQFIGIVGVSGSGKTTLIKHLNGLLKATSGDIIYQGKSIYDKKYILSHLRKEVGLVFQYPEKQLYGQTVLKDVCVGPINMGMSKGEAEESAKECLELVGISDEYYASSPFELSGGQKRCVAIAGVLAMQPKILVLDEPAAGLDPETRKNIFDLIEKIRKEKNITIVLVSHHMEDVAQYADRVIVLNEGKIYLDGTPKKVFSHTEELRNLGIGVPQVTALTEKIIKREVLPLESVAITVDDAEKMILKNWRNRRRKEV